MALLSYKELTVWKKSIELVKNVYRVTAHFPKEELYGLASQMRRAAVSIPSNVAEGNQKTINDYIRFLRMSFGSAAELETQLIIAKDLYPDIHFIQLEQDLEEILKMLSAMIKNLSSPRPTRP